MNHRISCISAALAAAFALQATAAEAIVVARVTRRGYIVYDDVGEWGNAVPQENATDRAHFIGATTAALSELPDFTPGKFLAVMQVPSTQNPLAYYLPIRNDVRGIGQRSPLDARSEVFDTNSFYDTTFPLDGFVYLNSYRFYTDPRALIYGRFLICTQEFGHRHAAQLAVLPNPQGTGDSGVVPADAAEDAAADAGADVARDAAGDVADVPTGPQPLARDALLGRGNQNSAGMVVNRAHWSYFFNTGGSPMEGNAWTEFSPGMFRTERPTFRFSPLDLYVMGLIPASQVPPTYLIAEPSNLPRGVSRDSPPEYYNRQVTIRGRRVDVTIEDIQRANGPRNPAYSSANHDLDVMWVLLAEEGEVNDQLAAEFDEAIDSCALGYAFATGERGVLRAVVPPQPDAEAPADAAVEDVAAADAAPARDAEPLPDVPTIPAPDGMANPDGGAVTPPPAPLHAEGGCQCAVPAAPRAPSTPLGALALGLFAFSRRKRSAR